MTLPPGFKATLFAGEPDVKQPIAFAIDDRGSLCVAEAYTSPVRAPEGQGKDRILVFEDTDGDGKFNRRTVFMEGLNLVSGFFFQAEDGIRDGRVTGVQTCALPI